MQENVYENLRNPARARRARAMQENVYENLRNPARARRAGAMRWFPTNIGIHQNSINTQRKPIPVYS
jgi:hypothetical protein